MLRIGCDDANFIAECEQVVREHHGSGRDVEYIRRHMYDGTSGPTTKDAVGAALVDGLVPRPEDHKMVKSRFSAFFATNLDLVLRREGIQHIVIAGKSMQSKQYERKEHAALEISGNIPQVAGSQSILAVNPPNLAEDPSN